MTAGASVLPSTALALDAETDARLAEADAGPETIDVSGYPAPLQEAYAIFSEKCSQCHTLSRPINSQYVLPEEWERYVKRMMRKPDSNISTSEAKQIFEFLSYDSSVRKKDVLESKLSALDADERQEATERIDEIRKAYGAGS